MKKLIDVGVKVAIFYAGCKMVRGCMVIVRSFQFGTLYKLESYTI